MRISAHTIFKKSDTATSGATTMLTSPLRELLIYHLPSPGSVPASRCPSRLPPTPVLKARQSPSFTAVSFSAMFLTLRTPVLSLLKFTCSVPSIFCRPLSNAEKRGDSSGCKTTSMAIVCDWNRRTVTLGGGEACAAWSGSDWETGEGTMTGRGRGGEGGGGEGERLCCGLGGGEGRAAGGVWWI